jgi:formate-dependent nitrite reductase membrane component NrfD
MTSDRVTGGTGAAEPRRRRGGRRRDQAMVPEAEFRSYYGKPILNEPTWEARDIAGYLFLGGLAGAGAAVAGGASATGLAGLGRVLKVGSTAAAGLSLAALVHDLGRPTRFLNMLRVAKPTSPMSVGSWLLAGFAPLSATAAFCEVTGRLPRLGTLATAGAATLGPAVATYTAALISNTAVPAWHEARAPMPFLFASSGAAAAAGLGLLAAPATETAPVRVLALVAAPAEVGLSRLAAQQAGLAGECYERGRAGRLLKTAEALTLFGAAAAVFARRSPALGRVGGLALLTGSALTRFGLFEAGLASARDPKYTVVPQRERLSARAAETT